MAPLILKNFLSSVNGKILPAAKDPLVKLLLIETRFFFGITKFFLPGQLWRFLEICLGI